MLPQHATLLPQEQIFHALQDGGDKVALIVDKGEYTYSQVRDMTFALGKALMENQVRSWSFLSNRTVTSYQCFFAGLMAGTTNIPLTSTAPLVKVAFVMEHTQCELLAIDYASASFAASLLLEHVKYNLLAKLNLWWSLRTANQLWADLDKCYEDLCATHPEHSERLLARLQCIQNHIHVKDELAENPELYSLVPDFAPRKVDGQDTMYVMYTSGTTGHPKGVAISYESYRVYLNSIFDFYKVSSEDILANFPDLTYDLGIQDPACAFLAHAQVVCPSKVDMAAPWHFINKYGITMVNSLPSLIKVLYKTTTAKQRTQPCKSLRLCVFVGEPLWYNQVEDFQKLFPNCRIINSYGPTKATVVITYYNIPKSDWQHLENKRTMVPLGMPIIKMPMLVVDKNLNEVPVGEQGTLLLGGPQVGIGYYNDEIKTQENFIFKGQERYYNTGDIVYLEELTDAQGQSTKMLHFVGRNDDLIKVDGYRVSLYEVEERLNQLCNQDTKVIAYYNANKERNELIAYLTQEPAQGLENLKAELNKYLSFYMQPSDFVLIESFPLSANGKTDRKRLLTLYQERCAACAKE